VGLQQWANIGIKIATALSQSFFAARAIQKRTN